MFGHWRITRYLWRELRTPTVLALLLYTFVLLMNHFFLVAEKSLSKNLGADLTLRLFLIGVPKILVLTIPMAVLLGTLIALGRLSSDQEWVALQSAGAGFRVLLRPVLLHGLVATVISLWIYAVLVPRTNYAYRGLTSEILFSSNLASDLKPRMFYDLPQNAVMFVDDIRQGVEEKRLAGVLLVAPGEQGATKLALARYGDLYPAPDRSGALLVDLYDGEVRSYRTANEAGYQHSAFRRSERYRLEPPPFLRAMLDEPQKVVQDFSFPELWSEVREAREAYDLTRETPSEATRGRLIVTQRRLDMARIELHQRLALPAACLLFAFLALPLGITRVRAGKGAGFALSLLVILVYRIVFVLTRNRAATGDLHPVAGVWAANALILVWALIALWRLRGRETRSARWLSSATAVWAAWISRWRGRRRSAALEAGVSLQEEARAELATLGGTPTRFVGRLDRYIGGTYLKFMGYALVAAYLIYGLIELQRLTDGLLKNEQPPVLLLSYFKYFLPTVLSDVLPVACLVGAVVSMTLLARSSELVAMMASGIGLRRATYPVIGATLALCGVMFLVQDRIAPPAKRKAETIKDQILGYAPRTYGIPVTGRWGFGPEGKRLYHYRLYDPTSREFRDLSVFTLDRSYPRIVDHRFAQRARWDGEGWELEGGWLRTFTASDPGRGLAPTMTMEEFDEPYRLDFELPRDLAQQHLKSIDDDLPDQLSVSEMGAEISRLQKAGYDSTRMRVTYHGKYARTAAPLVMILLGLPFAFKIGRRGSLYGIGVALLLVLIYWATFAVFNALGLETVLRPMIAAWTPNVLFGLIGVYLLLFVRT